VQTPDGRWTKVEPVENSVLIAPGDLMQRWTANRIKASVSVYAVLLFATITTRLSMALRNE